MPGSVVSIQLHSMPGWNVMEEDLAERVRIYQLSSLMDHTNEGPHSLFNKENVHDPSSTFVWQASTVRVNRNSRGARSIHDAFDVDVQREWDISALIC